MKILKIILTLCVLSFSSSLFASSVLLHLMPPEVGRTDTRTIYVEYRAEGEVRWRLKTVEGGFQTYITVDNLHDGVEYQFRVTLVSFYGPGEPSEPTIFVKADMNDIQEIYVKCNPPATLRSISGAKEISTTFSGLVAITDQKTTKVPFKAKNN